jgi:hypothetical protein
MEIVSNFESLPVGALAYAESDVEAVVAYLQSLTGTPITARWEYISFFVSYCSDNKRVLDEEFLEQALADGRRGSARFLEAEALRALGLARADPGLLDQAVAVFADCGAPPYEARARIEAAILRGDRGELDTGMKYLESIRDNVQVERFERDFRDRPR